MKLGERTDTSGPPATDKQRAYILALCRHLHMPGRMMDDWLQATYGRHLETLTIAQASAVIDILAKWEDIPSDIRRASGQQELW